MCGIAGIIRWDGAPVAEPELRAMCGAMDHRGPDDEGFYFGDGVGLGMRRLSIIDLDAGQQPVANEDGTVWVVFNGEIYNYRELRRHLERRGHVFRTSSDTETIVHLYEEVGAQCVDQLRGMFALAVWDTRRREVLLARDRLGHQAALLRGAQWRARVCLRAEVDPATPPHRPHAELGGGPPSVHVSGHAAGREHRPGREETGAGADRRRTAGGSAASHRTLLGRRVRA